MRLPEYPGCFRVTKWSNTTEAADVRGTGCCTQTAHVSYVIVSIQEKTCCMPNCSDPQPKQLLLMEDALHCQSGCCLAGSPQGVRSKCCHEAYTRQKQQGDGSLHQKVQFQATQPPGPHCLLPHVFTLLKQQDGGAKHQAANTTSNRGRGRRC